MLNSFQTAFGHHYHLIGYLRSGILILTGHEPSVHDRVISKNGPKSRLGFELRSGRPEFMLRMLGCHCDTDFLDLFVRNCCQAASSRNSGNGLIWNGVGSKRNANRKQATRSTRIRKRAIPSLTAYFYSPCLSCPTMMESMRPALVACLMYFAPLLIAAVLSWKNFSLPLSAAYLDRDLRAHGCA
jgi:hypothetical protein